MATDAQILANQANSQHSTGPVTPEGLAASSLNNLRHGLAGSRWLLTADEDLADFDTLRQSLTDEHQPATATEIILVERMAQHFWMGQRALRLQAGTMEHFPNVDQQQLSLFIRYQSTHDRAFSKCLSDLRNLRKERLKAQIDFVSQKAETDQAAETRKQEMHAARTRAIHAKAAFQELENDIKAAVDAPMPGKTRIPFELLKSVLAQALAQTARDIEAYPELAAAFKDAA